MGGKKIKGRKRHIVTDTAGRMLYIKVHEANTHDTVAGVATYLRLRLTNTLRLKVFVRMPDIERQWKDLLKMCYKKLLRFPRG